MNKFEEAIHQWKVQHVFDIKSYKMGDVFDFDIRDIELIHRELGVNFYFVYDTGCFTWDVVTPNDDISMHVSLNQQEQSVSIGFCSFSLDMLPISADDFAQDAEVFTCILPSDLTEEMFFQQSVIQNCLISYQTTKFIIDSIQDMVAFTEQEFSDELEIYRGY